uniref:Uncharacterized protein n=1 Tax=Toxoplasma gondii TgCATBr9 TaxID=943120 RepID=A0A2T6IVJ5_TOXGO|nr:hypothetical protein TGBR9_382050 [Toxoplasma gondii TgCATBr9]
MRSSVSSACSPTPAAGRGARGEETGDSPCARLSPSRGVAGDREAVRREHDSGETAGEDRAEAEESRPADEAQGEPSPPKLGPEKSPFPQETPRGDRDTGVTSPDPRPVSPTAPWGVQTPNDRQPFPASEESRGARGESVSSSVSSSRKTRQDCRSSSPAFSSSSDDSWGDRS